MILEKVKYAACTAGLLDPGKLILIGFSGGADSLCLMHTLHCLDYTLAAAHFDHGLRPESATDAEKAKAAAVEIGVPFYCERGDVAALAKNERLSIEEAARIARYRFLFEQARQFEAQAVVVGHTADDQCETVLMHFLRGSGTAGMRGMRPRAVLPEWDAQIPLVRPLLGVWREETQAYCRDEGLEPITDPSNEQSTFFRNRLRQEVIPYLEQFNPAFKPSLLRMAEVMAGEEEILAAAEADAEREGVIRSGEGYTAVHLPGFASLPTGLQRRLVRQAAARLLPGLRDFEFDSTERVLDLAMKAQSDRPLDLSGGLRALREYDTLYLYLPGTSLPAGDFPQLEAPGTIPLAVPGRTQLQNKMILTSELIEPFSMADLPGYTEREEAWLDADSVGEGLVVREPHPGDRFQPLGMTDGSIKVSDFFTNEKVPARLRHLWPLVYCGEHLVWISCCRQAEFTRVTEKTSRAVHLKLVKTA